MPQTDPVTGVSYFIGSDKPSIPTATKGLADSIRSKIIPIYPTATARDLAITAAMFTPSGIPEGFKVYVKKSGDWEWDGLYWKPLGASIVGTYTYTGVVNNVATPVLSPSNLGVKPSNVPGIHGQSFTLARTRMISAQITYVVTGDTPPQQYRVQVFDTNNVDFCDVRLPLTVSGGKGAHWNTLRSFPRPLAFGDQAIGAYFSLPDGAGLGQISLGSMTVRLYDEGPA